MKHAIRYIGWWGAPVLWAANMQVGQITPYADCATRISWTSISTLAALALTLVLAAAAFRTTPRRPGRFAGWPAGVFALIFGFALALQAAASMMIDPCLR